MVPFRKDEKILQGCFLLWESNAKFEMRAKPHHVG